MIRDRRPREPGADPMGDQGNGHGAAEQRTLVARALSRVMSDGSLTKKASLNAVAATAEQAARILAGLIITPFIVTRLGDALYGTWQVLQRMIGHASPASGRPGEALKWTIAHDQASDDYDRKRRQVGNAVAVWVLFLPVLLVTGGILAWFSPVWIDAPLSSYGTIRTAGAILVVDAVVFALFYLPQSVLQGENLGYKRLGLSVLLVFVSKSMLALAVYLTSGIVAMALATVAGTVLWGIAYVVIARSRVSWFGIARPSLAEVRGFVRLSWWFLLWNLVMTVSLGSDVVVLGIAGSTGLVTTYSLARYLPQAITVAVATLIFAIMPGLGGLIGKGDLRRAVRIRGETMSLVWLFTVVAGATVLMWVESFLRLWVGARYYPGPGAMLMIMLMVLQFSLIRTDANIIDLTLNLRRKVLLGTISAALAVALGWFFLAVLDMGIAGLALGFILGRAIQSVAYPLMIGRVLGTPPETQLRAVLRPGIATTAVFAAATALSLVVQAGSWVMLVVDVGASAAVLAVVGFFAGLSTGSRRIVWQRVRKVARLT